MIFDATLSIQSDGSLRSTNESADHANAMVLILLFFLVVTHQLDLLHVMKFSPLVPPPPRAPSVEAFAQPCCSKIDQVSPPPVLLHVLVSSSGPHAFSVSGMRYAMEIYAKQIVENSVENLG